MHPDCKWVHPTYRKDVMEMMEDMHKKAIVYVWNPDLKSEDLEDWSGHDKFKRIKFNDAGVPEVWE
jgi:hypothetical protein